MKKTFISSYCRGGIIGGALYADESALTFKTNKLTVAREVRNLTLRLDEIEDLQWKWIVFPIASIKMKSGETHRFIIFNKWRFDKHYKEISTLKSI